MRERVQVPPHETDDELVVGHIEPVAGQANVVSQLLGAVGHANLGMLAEHLRLLLRIQAGERGRATQRVPDVPAIRFMRDVLDRTSKQRPLEIGLVTRRIGPPQHRKPGTHACVHKRVVPEQRTDLPDEVRGIVAPREKPEPSRGARVRIHDCRDPLARAGVRQAAPHLVGVLPRRGVEYEELHEEAPIHRLAHSLPLAAVLEDVNRRQAGLS